MRSPHPIEVAVLGGGRLARAMCALLAGAGHTQRLWARTPQAVAELPDLIPRLRLATSVEDACRGAQLICYAVPAHALREVARASGDASTGDQIAVHACRGVGAGFALPADILRAETCLKQIAALGGPLTLGDREHREGASPRPSRPLVGVLASRFDGVHRALKAWTAETALRLQGTHDVVGVQVAGALSNVAQFAAGLAEGAGLSATDQGVLLTRGLAEATRIGMALGAERATFAGLAGVGDLIPRPVSSTARHRQAGIAIASGNAAEGVLGADPHLEGVVTAREGRALGAALGLSLPLVDAVASVLFDAELPLAALERVLSLDLDLQLDGAS